MGVVLPGWADEILDIIGVSWPNVDEDDYRAMATAMREFAGDINDGAGQAHEAVQALVSSAGGGQAADALNAHWSKINGTHLAKLAQCGELAATALDGVAVLIEGAKLGAIVQLGILAAEVIAAQAAAPFTFGLSELGALGATQATRVIVKRLFKEVCQQVAEQVVSIALTPVEEALGAMAGDLVVQLGANALGVQDGVDVGRTAKAGKEGFSQGVQGAKDAAGSSMQLLSAGGGGGGGAGGGSGSGGFTFDHDAHDKAVTGLASAGGHFRNNAGGKIGRAKSHHGRTRGKDAIANAVNPMIDKVVDGLQDAVTKSAKHLDDSMTRGVKQMAKNHKENDKGLADHFTGLGKGGRKDPKGPGTSLASAGKGNRDGGHPDKRDASLAGLGKGGQSSHGNIGCHTAGDPVDVVSGQMITNVRDLALPGLLPLMLRRAYASGYGGGRLYGPGWSSTLDQRVEIGSGSIHYAGDDAQILHYPLPTRSGEQVFPECGARWPLTWDQHTDTIRIEDPDRGWTRSFAPSGTVTGLSRTTRAVTGLTDRNGHHITFVRDEEGNPTEVRHTGGYRVAVDTAHTAAGLRIEGLRLLDGIGPGVSVVGYEYREDGRLAGVIDSTGLPYEYEYDDADRIVACTDRNGRTYSYVYDGSGRVVRGVGEGGDLSAAFHYDPVRQVTTVTDSLGHPTEYHYDDQQRVTTTVDPLGHTTHVGYDSLGRVVSRTDEAGRTVRFELDANGDPVRITEPDGGTVELDYTALRRLAAVRRADTVLCSFTYDARGNVLSSTDATGARTVRQYDDLGRQTSITDPLGRTQHITANAAGLVTAVTDAMGNTTRADYDAFGRVISLTGPLGTTTRLEYRREGEVTRRVHPDGTVEEWRRDAEGNLIEHRDRAGAVSRFEIGSFGQVTSRTLPDGEVHHFTYDTELRLLSVATHGAVWQYRYDAAGHLVGETDFNGHSFTYRLDGADQLLETTDASGRSSLFTYDALGQLTAHRGPDGTTTTLTYDEYGLPETIADENSRIEYVRDAAGRVLSETVDGRTTRYTRDVLGRCTSRTTPTGLVSTWTFDNNDQPVGLANAVGRLAFARDAEGRETTRFIGDGAALTQTWDDCDRLTAQSVWSVDRAANGSGAYTSVQERIYKYRADGMPTAVTDRLRGRQEFELSPAGRVTRVSAPSWSEQYAYDPLGNITRAQDTRAPDSSTAGERVHSGTLLLSAGRTSYKYDDRGRLACRRVRTLSGKRREWRYTWNGQDQLVRIDTPDRGSWTYSYDPLGRRTGKRRLGDEDGSSAIAEQHVFAWEGTHLIEQCRSGTDGRMHALSWDWEPGTWNAVAQTERTWNPDRPPGEHPTDESFCAIVTDLADKPAELVSLDGRIVWADHSGLWGDYLPGATGRRRTCPLGRPGQYHDDESGLEYNCFRYYDPSTGRYISSDPLGLDGGPNPHSYVPNPLFWIDPLGLASRQPVGWGGSYYGMRPSNWTDGSDTNRYERNHLPAKATYKGIGNTPLPEQHGPAIRMHYDDHRDFISTGSGIDSVKWRADQRALIAQGKIDEAMKMDIDEIRRKHGTKYDAAIKEMVDSLPHNKYFQKYLSDNGWKIRTCLLQ
ncbi:RHS repeat-associated core domain-containing protein [Streptomyces monomycini]|uniref:RHS repeat-associated core domain-containing protein n=1 Tax=Streptomyces monomycini TaxID=371720 RepID=UPI0012FE9E36|nr:RHS repeat-associated core domain-containing protein [Streptomyces monomycini]